MSDKSADAGHRGRGPLAIGKGLYKLALSGVPGERGDGTLAVPRALSWGGQYIRRGRRGCGHCVRSAY